MQRTPTISQRLPDQCFRDGKLAIEAFREIHNRLLSIGFTHVPGEYAWRHASGTRAVIRDKMLVRHD